MKKMSKPVCRASATAVALLLAVAGCGDSTEPQLDEIIEEVEFHESLNVDLDAMTRTVSGLYYEDVVVGDGQEAVPGSMASVDYTVRFRDGSLLDSNASGAPLTFEIDGGGYYDGFNEGVRGMRVGGERKLLLPPELGDPVRFPGRILIFDVALVGVADQTP